MDNGEKLIALKESIIDYAKSQFKVNYVSQAEALIVMNAVLYNFQDEALHSILMKRIEFNNDDTSKEREDGDTE